MNLPRIFYKLLWLSSSRAEEQWKIIADMDILGSASGGLYGFGHPKEVYLEDDFREAFANMYLAYKYGWTEYKRRWPKLWKYMEDLLK